MEGREDEKDLHRLRELEEQEEGVEERGEKKKTEYDGSMTGLDMKMDRPLHELDPVRFKREIRRWARAVVRYARQLSRSLSSHSFSRSRRSSVSSFRFHEDEASGSSA